MKSMNISSKSDTLPSISQSGLDFQILLKEFGTDCLGLVFMKSMKISSKSDTLPSISQSGVDF